MSKELRNIDGLKELALKTILERFRRHETGFEIVGAVSSDAAITMLRVQNYFDARLLQNVARADKATRELAAKLAMDIPQAQKTQYIAEANRAIDDLATEVDVDGIFAEQVTADCAWAEVQYLHALNVLRRLTRSGNSTSNEQEEREKYDALQMVVPTWVSTGACNPPVSDREATAAVEILGRLAGFHIASTAW